MDFPASPPVQIDVPPKTAQTLGKPVEWAGRSANHFLLALLVDERAVRELSPNIAAVAELPAMAGIVTAPADSGHPQGCIGIQAQKTGHPHGEGSAGCRRRPRSGTLWQRRLSPASNHEGHRFRPSTPSTRGSSR